MIKLCHYRASRDTNKPKHTFKNSSNITISMTKTKKYSSTEVQSEEKRASVARSREKRKRFARGKKKETAALCTTGHDQDRKI